MPSLESRPHSLIPWLVIPALAWALIPPDPAQAQRRTGYRLTNNAIVVDNHRHWQRWSVPVHAVDLNPDGSVTPHRFRDRFNILDDRETFTRTLPGLKRSKGETAILNVDSTETLDVRGEIILDRKDNPIYTYFLRPGISRVGSNPEAAANVLDGDPSTWWEPDPRDPVEDWWLEIDLGRVVPVDTLRLHFVEEDLGDPFRQFRLLAAPDQEPVAQDADRIDFFRVGGTEAPNESRRTFSFDFPLHRSSSEWTGRMVQTIRVVVTDSRQGRGQLLDGEEAWLALDPGDRGDILYYIRDLAGTEEPVEREVYESLGADRQGRRDYYRRERPRLADVEIWGAGDNISPGIIEGGGSVFLTGGTFAPGPGFDGDFSTNFLHLVWSPTIDRGVLTVDLAATFWLDAMRISTSRPRPYIDGYIVRASDGSLDASGRINWTRISPRSREDNSVSGFQNLLDPYDLAPLRFLEVSIVSVDPRRRGGYNTGPTIAEYQLFSKGHPAEVLLTSDLIELPGPRHFGAITWEADVPPGTGMEIRTRSGDLLGRIVRYFDRQGQEIAYTAWKNLIGSFKGPVDTTLVPTAGWSSWSRAYEHQGDRVTSPGLRRFAQIQVRLTTTDRDLAAAIRSIRVELLNPVAERILAEITPTEVPAVGRIDTFDVFLQPRFISRPSPSLGFDELLLSMPASGRMELIEMEIDGGREGERRLFTRGPDGGYADGGGDRLSVVRQRADSIWVRLADTVTLLPDTSRAYYRITADSMQVPVTQDGILLSAASWGLLDDDEQGKVLYFRRLESGELEETDQRSWEELDESERLARYFRVQKGDGAQYPFDDRGDSLDASDYSRLSRDERGRVVGPGPRVRVRFQAPVLLNGTTLNLAVRNAGADPEARWQSVEAGDAVPDLESNTLTLSVPLEGEVVEEVTISPNPFSPNGDLINDQTEIGLSIYRITDPRSLRVSVYTLAGRRVWREERVVAPGLQSLSWDGRDSGGNLVPPGIYIVKLHLDVDTGDSGRSVVRTVAVAY